MAFASNTLNKNSALKRRKRNRLYVIVFLWVLLLGVLLGGAVAVSWMDQFQIKNVVISGNTVTDGVVIEDLVRSELKDSYLWMFPRANSFLFPKSSIESALLSEFSRIEKVEVSRADLSTLSVVVSERKPKALWCEGVTPFLTGKSMSDCYFLDTDGLIFSRAPIFSRNVFVRYFGNIGTTTIGSLFAPEKFTEYDFFVQSLRREKLAITDMVILRNGDIELYLESGVKILFDTKQSLGTILSNIKLLIEKEELALLSATPRFEYIDLRYGNKVFYKNK